MCTGVLYKHITFYISILLGIFLFSNFATPTTFAQIANIGEQVPQIVISPNYPEPFGEISATIQTSGNTITWYINGKQQPEFNNKRSLTTTVAELGTKIDIKVVTITDSVQQVVTKSVSPSILDIIIEANTLVPAFYKGRALPIQESNIRIIAIPHLYGVTKTENLIYKWKYNQKVLFGGPVTGLASIPFTMPLTRKNILSVTVLDTEGTELLKKNIVLTPVKPELHFYENNPLRGLSRRALSNPYTLIGDEVTVRAEPYFITPEIFSANGLFKWQLNGRAVGNSNELQNELTLRHTEGGGSAQISLLLQHTKLLMHRASDYFTIFFETRNTNK